MKAKLFQFAAIYHPTKEEEKDGKISELIIEPATLLATEEQVAVMKAVRMIPPKYEDKLENIDIVVRPF